jgi:Holliday junction resolvasome RuvABC endonuclease subunit
MVLSGTILGLDPSKSRTGWSLVKGPAPVAVIATGSQRADRLNDFILWFKGLLAEHAPAMICYEQPLQVIFQYGKKQLLPGNQPFTTPNADQIILWKLEGALEALAANAKIPTLSVPVRTWRAAVLGSGKLSRNEAKSAAKLYCERIGAGKLNEDEAEAVCIGIYGATSQAFRYHLFGSRGT